MTFPIEGQCPVCKQFPCTNIKVCWRVLELEKQLARLVEAAKHYIITPDADEITKRLALHDLRVCISGVEDDK